MRELSQLIFVSELVFRAQGLTCHCQDKDRATLKMLSQGYFEFEVIKISAVIKQPDKEQLYLDIFLVTVKVKALLLVCLSQFIFPLLPKF